jgi:DNA-binding transcriptional LysR family regulator
MQQPTLSRHVAELEAQLGAPLFERTGRGVVPTGAALAIANAARMVRPVQQSLVARKLGDIAIVAAAHRSYLAKAPPLRRVEDLAAHRLIGYDRDDSILRAAARMGLPLSRADFAIRTDDQVAYGRLVAEAAGIGFVARYNLRHWPGVVAVLPALPIATLPCWLAVHREIRSNPLVRTVYDFLGGELAAAIRG